MESDVSQNQFEKQYLGSLPGALLPPPCLDNVTPTPSCSSCRASSILSYLDTSLLTSSRVTTDSISKCLGLTINPAAGVYLFTPLGARVLGRLERLIEAEFDATGAQRSIFPILFAPELMRSKESDGRLERHRESMLETHVGNREFLMNPSSEELAVWAVRVAGALSYRDLPRILYDHGTRFRTSVGAKGIHRAIEFRLLEAYAFCTDRDAGRQVMNSFDGAITKVCEALHLKPLKAESRSNHGEMVCSNNFYLCMMPADLGDSVTVADEFVLVENDGRIAATHVRLDQASRLAASLSNHGNEPTLKRALRVGQTTELGTTYCTQGDLSFQSANNLRCPPYMISAGLSINRVFVALLEARFSSRGMKWPSLIAPFDVAVVPLGSSGSASWQTAEALASSLSRMQFSVLFDDRIEPASKKLADHEFLGVPCRVLLGPRVLKQGAAQVVIPEYNIDTTVALETLENTIIRFLDRVVRN